MSEFLLQGTGNEDLDKAIDVAGYNYDSTQDIFWSNLDSWQRKVGYCRLYDEAAAPLGMIMDCEEIYFQYLGQKWMIGLWKGQYDMVTGGEIGVYNEALDLKILGIFKGTFYQCASDAHLLQMSFTLKKNGKPLFTRSGKHWWLTGFKLGEFSQPSELSMDVSITLENAVMRDAFVAGLWNAGYTLDKLSKNGNTVSFKFGTPHTPQPLTRTKPTDRLIQWKNQQLCLKYQKLTEPFVLLPDKVKAIEEKAPKMSLKILKLGKAKPLYERYVNLIKSVISANQTRGEVLRRPLTTPVLPFGLQRLIKTCK